MILRNKFSWAETYSVFTEAQAGIREKMSTMFYTAL